MQVPHPKARLGTARPRGSRDLLRRLDRVMQRAEVESWLVCAERVLRACFGVFRLVSDSLGAATGIGEIWRMQPMDCVT